jgi:NitT/TauT family transport system substrate-binding protein
VYNRPWSIFISALMVILTACGPSAAVDPASSSPAAIQAAPTVTATLSNPAPTTTAPQPATSKNSALRKVVLGMGFIPNVQFAPFYVADAKGYFADEGLQVEFDYGMDTDLLKLIGTGKMQFAIGSGDQVILARSQGLPAVYVASFYRKFPVTVMSLKDKGILKPHDLEGKTVGISCLCGSSYVAWKALAYATGLDTNKVNLQVIGFTQATTLERGQVDAALDYAVNGPVQLRLENKELNLIGVSDYINLVSNGIISSDDTIQKDPGLVQGVVRAFLRGLRDTLSNPQEALDSTLKYVPEAGGANRPNTEAVLTASIELWRGEDLGLSKREDWDVSQAFMKKVGLIEQTTESDKLFTNQFAASAK